MATAAATPVSIDTTGLPEGATFSSAVTGEVSETSAPTMGETVRVERRTIGPSRSSAGPLQIGQAFGPRYHILKLLGAGGMGAVYQAWDAELSIAVALKVIRTERHAMSTAIEQRFKNELLLARQVTHKNVVRIHDLGEIDGIKYITMPYVQGDDLATVLSRDGKMPIPRALQFARQIASGLQAAHDAGVVHRDLKPANIMIGGAKEDPFALIMDFGISASATSVKSGEVIGTFEYMAPEQAEGRAVDARADIYAFGLILYEMLAGTRSPSSTTPGNRLEAMKQRFADGVPPLRSVDATIPEPLAGLVSHCLSGDPAQRCTSAELVARLARLDDNGELIPEPRHVTPRLMAAAAVLLVALAAGTYVIGRRAAPVQVEHEATPVLIADFDNRSGDPSFEGSVEQTLTLSMERASYISVFRTRDARADAAQLAPGKGDRITPELGQLIARREGLKVLLTGSVDRRDSGFRVQVAAVDPATAKAITTVRRDVGDRSQVLPAVASMADQVREALGESKTEMAKLAAVETVTAGSLDAMRAYSTAQDLLDRARYSEAIPAYQEAIRLDPNMGRAYAGLAVAYRNLKQADNASQSYGQAIKLIDRMTDREKYRTLGGYYFTVVHNYDKAVENYESLFKLFPADKVGLQNLAFAHLMTANIPRAVLFGKQAMDADPKSVSIRYNYADYAMYAGDFAGAKAQTPILLKADPTFYLAWLPFAQSSMSEGDVAGARDAYQKMAAMGPAGQSLAAMGEADGAMYLGRYKDAVTTLRAAIAMDEKNKDTGNAANKYIALAEAELALGQKKAAADAAAKAVALSRDEFVVFPAARVFVRVGQEDKATAVASSLANMLQTQTAAYADLVRGDIAMQHGDVAGAIESFKAGQKRHNLWFAHYLLGSAYASAEHFSEALTEFDACVKRRGEVNDVFFQDTPTLRYLPPVYYWLARSQDAMGVNASAKSNYEQFVKVRSGADPADPLVADARQRLVSGAR